MTENMNRGRLKPFCSALLVLMLPACSSLPRQAATIDVFDPDSIDRILATDPSTLTPELFSRYEFAILAGYSGSGGCYLEEPHIAWLRKAEAAFQKKGIQLEDNYGRHGCIADSYFNSGRYHKALREFTALNSRSGIELSEWFINNEGLGHFGKVNVVEYETEIPCKNSETARAQNERYLFVAYFKGPIYRYDKLTKKHELIFAPKDKYDWCDKLEIKGSKVIIRLREDTGTYAYDNESGELRSICNVLREPRKASLK